MESINLEPGREKSVLNHHPWIFENSVHSVTGHPQPGESVEVRSARGESLGIGAFSPSSSIRVRMWTWDSSEQVDADFFREKIACCQESRSLLSPWMNSNAYRLIYAEADGLPGLIVDRYEDSLVEQCLSAGVEYWREVILDVLSEDPSIRRIYERSDVDVRSLEGLPSRKEQVRGERDDHSTIITENDLKYSVDILEGQKTGFYLDQRENRLKIRKYARDREVLDCFSYTGGFTVALLEGGARHVTTVDESEAAHQRAQVNVSLNGFSADKVEWLKGDVFKLLREFRDRGKSFDMIVLDPPKFAPTISQVGRATRGYKDINLLALKLLRPGGILITFSCSGGVDAALFQKIIAGAAHDAKVDAQIIERLGQAADHPVAINFPESEYLKGLVVLKIT